MCRKPIRKWRIFARASDLFQFLYRAAFSFDSDCCISEHASGGRECSNCLLTVAAKLGVRMEDRFDF